MTRYPRDEFDEVPVSVDRQGVHRERLMPVRPGGPALKILVGVLALLVGLAAFFLLPRLGLDNAGSNGDAGASAMLTDEAAPEASGPPRQGADGAGGAGGAASPSAGPVQEDPLAVDRTQAVNILNSTGTAGLATTAASRPAPEGDPADALGSLTLHSSSRTGRPKPAQTYAPFGHSAIGWVPRLSP